MDFPVVGAPGRNIRTSLNVRGFGDTYLGMILMTRWRNGRGG
ncbi:Uncharacterised protein [Klebsiella pneumoniae]|uniref:Uncharacterized protein n=1 Tax=Klebsiella pneumoniae TaxID=573 RepID=A0A447S7K5_KLEPN|nr:Uncharacterised protein [Klebsiella pneumoniae]